MQVLSANQTDVFVPYLLLATPHSVDSAFPDSDSYRLSQFKYVDPSTPLKLYFSEPVTGVAGKTVYIYGYPPTVSPTASGLTGSGADADASITMDAAGFTAGMEETMQSTGTKSLELTRNRLYTVLIDAGAFKDAMGSAAAGSA